MKYEYADAILLVVQGWLPNGWVADNYCYGRSATIRFMAIIRLICPNNIIRGRLLLDLHEFTIKGAVWHRGIETPGPTWDLRNPDSLHRIENWVRCEMRNQR